MLRYPAVSLIALLMASPAVADTSVPFGTTVTPGIVVAMSSGTAEALAAWKADPTGCLSSSRFHPNGGVVKLDFVLTSGANAGLPLFQQCHKGTWGEPFTTADLPN